MKPRARQKPAAAKRPAGGARGAPSFALPAPAALALVLAAAVALHRWVLSAPFFADDYLFLDQVRDRSLPAALLSPDPIGNFFRPVGRQAWFWLVGHASGQSPGIFHAVDLAVFLAALVLLHRLVGRLAGPRAAIVAAAFLAFNAAADVPLGWCSGSQDLLAVTGALGALLLYTEGCRVPAALVLLLALLSKESVFAVPVVAILLDRKDAEPWRTATKRAWPLFAATVVWGIAWTLVARHRALGGGVLAASPVGLPAAVAHLVQVALGPEVHSGGMRHLWTTPPPWPLALALLAVLAAPTVRAVRGEPVTTRSRRTLVIAGAAWAVLGALPVAAVITIWSSYFYLFALCGVALALGAWCADRSRLATVAIVAVLAWGSQVGRSVDEFQTSPSTWSALSHVNRFYLDRALPQVTRYLNAMKRARPTLPHNTTVYFGSLRQFIGFQASDGPLVRWAYRDSSLRSYYFSAFSMEKVSRGPAVFLFVYGDSLMESTDPDGFIGLGISSILSEHPELGRDFVRYAITLGVRKPKLADYTLGVVTWMCADTSGAAAAFARASVTLAPGPAPGLDAARARATAGDTTGALGAMLGMVSHYGLDPELHAALADLCMAQIDQQGMGCIESIATCVLAPRDPRAWRRLGFVQMQTRHFSGALHSLERYFELGGATARADQMAVRALRAMRELQPGGKITQEALHGGAVIDLTR